MQRREVLRGLGAAASVGIAGCGSLASSTDTTTETTRSTTTAAPSRQRVKWDQLETESSTVWQATGRATIPSGAFAAIEVSISAPSTWQHGVVVHSGPPVDVALFEAGNVAAYQRGKPGEPIARTRQSGVAEQGLTDPVDIYEGEFVWVCDNTAWGGTQPSAAADVQVKIQYER